MGFFGKIKRKKRNEQQPEQQQQQQQPSLSRIPPPKAVENRADFNTQNQDVGYRDAQTRQLPLPSPPKSTTGKRLPSRSPPSSSSSSSRGGHKKALTTQPTNRPPPTTQSTQQKPPSILHKNTHYGTTYEILSPPPPQPPTFCHGMPVHGPNNPRVRFQSSGGDADASVASVSVASVPHMMVGANSIADSSAVSSNGMLNKVMEEEYRRLSAMGMGFEGR
mmetsp:Transcript_16616/g.29983  ORF Transcript_16616/g.29983 Transcript_16616/m.29983 type:complete len:220 (+) Transcript_16616:217-876(+)|eukprot:CAMPEP_0196135484 /NCGR_PEP_ID=MMETSP0910-20130528/4106_1 /TAXON_ID=49265 /ORGANISM="Thalassiosira rotula, Strain GSO102" /LENGTH=219 /DNA_ID=CAMNT_0041395633 /DNA_START=192 /DNA_END=851 /DNA_ORIENTATION=-